MVFGLDDIAFGAIASGALSAGSSLLGGAMGSQGQAATNATQLAVLQQEENFNAAEAQKTRDWQQDMSSTAYQRSMQDMRRAGLNPILAANLGGASTPSGATGSISGMPSLGNAGAAMGAGVASAGQAAAVAAQTKAVLSQAEKDRTGADVNKATETLNQKLGEKAVQETVTSGKAAQNYEANTRSTDMDTLNKGIDTIIKTHEANTAYQRSRLAAADATQSEKYGPGTWGALGGTVEKIIGRMVDAAKTYQGPGADSVYNRRKADNAAIGNTPGGPGLTIDINRRSK